MIFDCYTYIPNLSKKVFLGLFFFIATFFTSYSKYKVADTVYVRQTLNNYLYEYEFIYNLKGTLVENKIISWKDNKISSGFKTVYKINSEEFTTNKLYYGLVGDKWYLYSRENISYDINNLLVERIIENRKDGAWVPEKRYFYLYNSKNQNSSEYYQKWENEDWTSYNRKTYFYNENDSLTVFLSENLVENEWTYDYRFTKQYDINKNLTENMYEKWSNWKLVDYWKYNYTYYPNKNKETTVFEKLNKESNIPVFKFHYIYNESNKILQQTEFSWNDVEWIGKDRITNTYNNQSILTNSIYEKIWNNEWTEYKRISTIYNKFDKPVEIFEETFGTQWNPKRKEIYEYDLSGNELSWRQQEIFNDEFFDKYKIETRRDIDGYISEIVSLKQDFETWKWDSVNGSRTFIIKDNITEHNYMGLYLRASYKTINKIETVLGTNFLINPNPSSSFIRFQLDIPQTHVAIFDSMGSLLKIININEDLIQSIDINDLQPGIYFILIGNKTQKFIKQ